MDGFVSVPAGSVGVIYDRGRGVLEEQFGEGIHLKIPLWQVVEVIDVRLQEYTMSVMHDEGRYVGSDEIDALTKDGQKVGLDMTVQFKVDKDKAYKLYQEIGMDYEIKVIRPFVRSVIRDIVTDYNSTELFTFDARQEATEKMKEKLTELYGKQYIVLVDMLLRNVRFSDTYINAIEQKQIAQQQIQKAEYEKDVAQKIKERKIIEAEAEAEAIKIKGDALKNNPELLKLEFIQKLAPNINWGVLPDGVLPLIDLKNMNNK